LEYCTCGAETWVLLELDQKYLEGAEWCLEKNEEDQWTGRVITEEVLSRVKEEKTIFHVIKIRKAKWIAHVLRRNCLLEHVIEGTIEGTVRKGRRRKQLLDHCKGTRALDRTVWKIRFERISGPGCKTDYMMIIIIIIISLVTGLFFPVILLNQQ